MRDEDIQEVSENSWFAWSKHVLMQLENDAKCIATIKQQQALIREEIAALKVKSQVWGLIGGAIPAAVILAVAIIIWIVRK